MRHRITGDIITGLGNSSPILLDNKGKLTKWHKRIMRKAFEQWKAIAWGADYQFNGKDFIFGYEPAYQYQDLLIISISENKDNCFIETGRSWGAWGSQIAYKRKYYKEYKYNSKFTRYIDWVFEQKTIA